MVLGMLLGASSSTDSFNWWQLVIPSGSSLAAAVLAFFAVVYGQTHALHANRRNTVKDRLLEAEKSLLLELQESALRMSEFTMELDLPEAVRQHQEVALAQVQAKTKLTALLSRVNDPKIKDAANEFMNESGQKGLYSMMRRDITLKRIPGPPPGMTPEAEGEIAVRLHQRLTDLFTLTGNRIIAIEASQRSELG